MSKEIPLFTPVKVGRAAEEVALQIEAAILSGRIEPGQRLPSERALQAQFQTGRGVVREAMCALKQKGLVETRLGAKGGAVVRQVEVPNVSESLALFLKQHPVDPEHLVEFRESVDRAITLLAVSRGSDEDKRRLVEETARLEALANEPGPDMEAIGEMDRELNIRLARMTGNPVFEWIMRAVQQGFSSYDYALYEDRRFREKTAANWRDTAREIAAGEPLKALYFIGNHYFMLRRCVAEKRGGASDSAA